LSGLIYQLKNFWSSTLRPQFKNEEKMSKKISNPFPIPKWSQLDKPTRKYHYILYIRVCRCSSTVYFSVLSGLLSAQNLFGRPRKITLQQTALGPKFENK